MTQEKGVVFLMTSVIASPIYAKSLTDAGYTVANLVDTDEWKEHRMDVLRSALETHKAVTPKAAVMELNFVGWSTPVQKDLPHMLSLLGEQNISLALLTDTQTEPFELQIKSMWEGRPLRTVDLMRPDFNLGREVDALLGPTSLGETEKGR